MTKNADLLKCDWNRNEIAPLAPIELRYSFVMVSVSLLRLDRCKCGFEYILIVADHFKRFTQSYATRNKLAKIAAGKLFNNFMLQFGFPTRNHHDIEVLSLETIYLIICTHYSETSQLRISQIVDMPWIEDKMFSLNWDILC